MPPFGIPQPHSLDEGVSLPYRSNIDFVGSGVTVTDNPSSGRTTVTIPGGGGSSGGVSVINVKTDYGAVGNGSTDDTAAIQAALTACYNAGGGIVYLPTGVYRTTAMLQMKSDVWLMGDGYGNTRIQCDANANYDVIKIGDGTTTTNGNLGNGRFCKITDIEVDAGANKTAGAQIHLASTYLCKLKDVYLNGGYDGILIDGHWTTTTLIEDSVITAFTHHGVIFRVPDNGIQVMQNCLVGGHNSTGAGILWAQRDAVQLNRVWVLDSPILGGLCVEGDPAYVENTTTGSGVGNFTDCHFDAGDGPGVYINKNGMRFGMLEFIGCYVGSNTGHGVHIVDVDSFSWIGGKVIHNGQVAGGYSGFHIQGGTRILIDGATISRNGNVGITLGAGVGGVRIVNNLISNADLGYGPATQFSPFNYQNTGIVYGGSNTNCIITGNDMRGNVVAATSGTTPTGVVSGNL